MGEGRFDARAFESRLATRSLGRRLIARDEVGSTNDAAWEALAAGEPHGVVIVADAQSRGRGRAGRSWHTAPGKGLALSLLIREGLALDALGLLPLASGLALVLALRRRGVRAGLKWPNDVLLERAKLAGILCESRSSAGGDRDARGAVVIGLGVNVGQGAGDFPAALRASQAAWPATSLALAAAAGGPPAPGREEVAAEFLNELEGILEEMSARGPDAMLAGWREHASLWGERVRVRTSGHTIDGIADALDRDGALVLVLAGGERLRVLAGDLEPEPARPGIARPEITRG